MTTIMAKFREDMIIIGIMGIVVRTWFDPFSKSG